MKRPIQNFSPRYQSLQLPSDGPWLGVAAIVSRKLANGATILLWGNRGTGKSFMAYDLALHAPMPMDRNPDGSPRIAINATAMEIFMAMRGTWRKDSKVSEAELIEKWTDAALLVIDEIQERGESEFENQKLTAIVDFRYRSMRPTLLIGNFKTEADFHRSVSPSIISRMGEGGGSIHCDWPSFR